MRGAGISGDTGLRDRAASRQGRDDCGPVLWAGLRDGRHRLGGAGKAGRREEHIVCGQGVLISAVNWIADGVFSGPEELRAAINGGGVRGFGRPRLKRPVKED